MLSKFTISFIYRSVFSITAHNRCKCLNKCNTFQKKKWDLTLHLASINSQGIVDDGQLALDSILKRWANKNLDKVFLALDALIWTTMFDMHCNQLKKLGKEADPIEELGLPIHAPVQQVNKRHYSVGLYHVVPVFSNWTKYWYYFYTQLNCFS